MLLILILPQACAEGASWCFDGQRTLRRSAMESSKPAQNIQDSFLNTARKEGLNVTIYMVSGVKLTGRIRSFDKYSVVLEANGQEQLIFKHAISTVVIGRTGSHVTHLAHSEAKAPSAPGAATPTAASAASASGTEGEGFFGLRSSHPKKTRSRAPVAGRVPLGAQTVRKQDDQERAFLVGIDVRTRGRGKGAVTAQAQAARDAASAMGAASGKSGPAGKSITNKPSIPEFDAEESLAELRTLAESAGANVVGEILQRRDRPDPATLIGAGKVEEIAGAAASVNADLLLFAHTPTASPPASVKTIIHTLLTPP